MTPDWIDTLNKRQAGEEEGFIGKDENLDAPEPNLDEPRRPETGAQKEENPPEPGPEAAPEPDGQPEHQDQGQ